MTLSTTNTRPATAAGTLELGGDLTVNRLGFGAMRITGDGVWGPPADRETATSVLQRCLELGVDCIDTADSYGPEVSEELIADALAPYPDELVIATKGGMRRDGPGKWRPDCRPEHLRDACEGSLRRLRLDQISLYQLHTVDPDVPLAESLGTLVELRDEGKIRHIGVSNVDVDQLSQALDITPVVSVQNRYNVADRKSEPVLERCEAEGIAFIPWFPLAAGDMAKPGGPLHELARAHGASPAQAALAWLLARSPQMLPIPGTSSVAHLEENLVAAELHLSAEDMAVLDAA
ncbi:MAG: aldo/keto reductase [Acidimicrobiia bacterium]|jgi:aryl-alcohol dehydrogenase-like predicted oxidoreductase|nr:aldo/keto reductase [Acidimicrobiia bacterium]